VNFKQKESLHIEFLKPSCLRYEMAKFLKQLLTDYVLLVAVSENQRFNIRVKIVEQFGSILVGD
jgi:hypothetical protein